MEQPVILYVEDEPDYQVLVSGILAEAGIKTETADTGDEGLDRLTRRKPALLLLDVNLPDTTGYDLCSRIRQEEAWSEIPIMMLTVRRRPNEWLQGFSNGADDYLAKPFNPPELIERVQTILTGKPVKRLHTNDPEHLLIEAALSGNRSAFQVLLTLYRQPLMNYVRETVRDPSTAEDIVSSAFARAFQHLDRFRGDSTFFTWLYTIADNQMSNHWTYQNRLAPKAPDESHPAPSSTEPDAGLALEPPPSEQALRNLKRAVGKLPEEFRDPLRMHYLYGIPVKNVANRLGIPLGTVLSRLFRAKKMLRRTFEQQSL